MKRVMVLAGVLLLLGAAALAQEAKDTKIMNPETNAPKATGTETQTKPVSKSNNIPLALAAQSGNGVYNVQYDENGVIKSLIVVSCSPIDPALEANEGKKKARCNADQKCVNILARWLKHTIAIKNKNGLSDAEKEEYSDAEKEGFKEYKKGSGIVEVLDNGDAFIIAKVSPETIKEAEERLRDAQTLFVTINENNELVLVKGLGMPDKNKDKEQAE